MRRTTSFGWNVVLGPGESGRRRAALPLLASVLLAGAAATGGGCRPQGGSGGDARDESGSQEAAVTEEGLPEADLTGAPRNVATFDTLAAGVPVATRYVLRVKSRGALLLLKPHVDGGSCAGRDVDVSLAAQRLDDEGRLVELVPVVALSPARLAPGRYVLSVRGEASVDCRGVVYEFGLRFFGLADGGGVSDAEDDGAGDEPSGDGVDDDHDDDGDDGDDGDGGGDGDGEDDVHDDHDDPPPPPPACVWPPEPDVAAKLPAITRASFSYWGALSSTDGCKQQFDWRVLESLKPSPLTDCAAPTVRVDVRDDASFPMIKVVADRGAGLGDLQLFWLGVPDQAAAAEAKAKIEAGERIHVATALDDCDAVAAAGVDAPPTVPVEDPLALLLFAGEPRDLDGSGALAPAREVAPILGEDPSFAVTYAYGSAGDAATYRFHLRLKLDPVTAKALAGGARARFYNVRTRSYLADDAGKSLVDTSAFPVLSLTVTAPRALRQLLPRQRDLDLVLEPSSCGDGPCRTRFVVTYGRYFGETSLTPRFTDETRPGFSRFLLKEADLPAP